MAAPKKRPSRRDSEELIELPLDKLELKVVNKHGISKHVSALHVGFADGRIFMPFIPPPVESTDIATWEEWRTKMEYLKDDLQWLLRLPHHRFWSQVVYHKNLHECLLSFLSLAPRPFDRPDHNSILGEQEQLIYGSIHKLIFFIYLRMSTYKESKSSHISPDFFGELIYDHFLFDIPKIMDLCALYGSSNGPVLQKMLNNIFTTQPKFLQDLEDISSTLISVFDAVLKMLGLQLDEEENSELGGASSCPSLQNGEERDRTLTVPEVETTVDYLQDISHTLSSFLDVYPPACKILHDQNIEFRIASFYARAIERLQEEVNKLADTHPDLQQSLSVIRSCLLKLFRDTLSHCCIQPILEASSEYEASSLQTHVSELFRILASCLSEKQFICDYHSNFPVDDDLDMLRQTQCDIDEAHINFIVQSIKASFDSQVEIPFNSFKPEVLATGKPKENYQLTYHYENGLSSEVQSELEGACAGPRLQGVELDSLISLINSVLPGYDEGFLEECLDYYNYNHEEVIHHLLQDDIPEVLKAVKKSMSRKQAKEASISKPDLSLLSERKNIYDGDQFDVFSHGNEVDLTKIHKGKKAEDYNEILENRDHIKDSKSVYAHYDQVLEGFGDLYEDEYDDTYDSVGGWADEPATPDPLMERRAFTVPRVLRGKDYVEGNESEDEDETKVDPWTEGSKEEVRSTSEKRPDFVNSRNGPGAFSEHRHKDHTGPPRKAWDNVKGKPKGQGQDEKTQHGRSQKERHKSVYSNHNRRAQADRKRNQGMIRT